MFVQWTKDYPEDPKAWLLAMYKHLDPALLAGVQYYNPYKARMRHMLHWKRALAARRDASMVFQAAAEGRPMELAKRLTLGRLAGGHLMAGRLGSGAGSDRDDGAGADKKHAIEGYNALTAACARGHGECVRVLVRERWDADLYLKGRDPGGRGCWEVAKGDAVGVLEEIRKDPLMLCEDLPPTAGSVGDGGRPSSGGGVAAARGGAGARAPDGTGSPS